MLHDEHFNILLYEPDGSKIFSNTEIKGGIVVSYRDETTSFGAIKVFTKYPELNSILQKMGEIESSLSAIMINQNKFNLDALYEDHPEYQDIIGSGGRDKRFRNNIFDKISIFTELPSDETDIAVIGVVKNKRTWRYFPAKYVDKTHGNLYLWKVAIGAASGSGIFGEAITPPFILKPQQGYTQTYIGIGSFENEDEAENCAKYIRTKFLRTLLGVLKITQHNDISTWRLIPLQDFTANSDIDWSRSIAQIDRQLYQKYGLTPEEIDFIETHVKEME